MRPATLPSLMMMLHDSLCALENAEANEARSARMELNKEPCSTFRSLIKTGKVL